MIKFLIFYFISFLNILFLFNCDKGVNEDPVFTYTDDSLVVRAILDKNGLEAVAVDSVAVIDTIENRIGELILSNRNISVIPPQISNLNYLKKLNLEFNNLKIIPDELGGLKNLNFLYLAVNNLSELNTIIGKLDLHHLSLGNNQLTSLPSEIGNCSNLMQLQLSNNKLISLPPEISNLGMLENLWCESNQLKTLPDAISSLTGLKNAYFDKNYLTDQALSTQVITWLDAISPAWRKTQISSR